MNNQINWDLTPIFVSVFWGKFAKHEPQANAAMIGELAQWYGQGKISNL